MYPKTIQKAIELFSKLPGIGQRTATRFVFFLLKKEKKEIEEWAQTLLDLKEKIKICHFCFKPFEKEGRLCEICTSPSRNFSQVCVVEKEQDLEAIENARIYNGLYFILGGPFSKVSKEELEKVRVKDLLERIKNPEKFGIREKINEIILALNPTLVGETLILYLEKELKNLPLKITKLARGIPTGGEIEYADRESLESAFKKRD